MNWPLLVPLSVSLSNLKQTPSLSRRSNTISLTVANLDFCKFPLHFTSLHLSCPLAQPSTNSFFRSGLGNQVKISASYRYESNGKYSCTSIK